MGFPENAGLRRAARVVLPPIIVGAIRSIRRPTYRAEPLHPEPLDYGLLERFNENDYMFEHAGASP